ncbi:MAG TPA: hypothetical protein VLC91_07530 [Spongiibacteraceae bacterium]|nr:hypothetical protein [Spongiibacteraceae bacterium]
MFRQARLSPALFLIFILSGCGGGGGGGGGGGEEKPPPETHALHTVGGQITGLASGSIVLQLNGGANLVLTANGGFTFAQSLAAGADYNVTIVQQPAGLRCAANSGKGVMGSVDITSITVTCDGLYIISGTVTGLITPGLVLQLNGGSDLGITPGSTFAFPTGLPSGSQYQVSVRNNSTGQTCSVTGGTGTVARTDISNIAVTCSTVPPVGPSQYSIGGVVSGLTEAGLVINNSIDQVSVAANTTQFTFPTAVAPGTGYVVSIDTQPPHETCAINNGSGTVANSAVTSIGIICTPNTIQGGLSINNASLAFVAEQGAPLASQSITGTVQDAIAPVYVHVQHSNNGIWYVDYTQLTATTGQVVVTPSWSLQKPVSFNDTITVTACYDDPCTQHLNGSPKTIPVTTTITAAVPPPVLLVSDHGIAFTSGPLQSSLSRAVKVTDTSSSPSTWTATSSQSWLAATASGNSGDTLHVTANPTGLGDGYYSGVITVTAANLNLQPQSIQVGVYVTGNTPAVVFAMPPALDPGTRYAQAADNWVVDPVRPLLYTATGSVIAIDHTYTGARQGTITVPAAALSSLTISDDGANLYGLDIANGIARVHVIDLSTQQVTSTFTFPSFDSLQNSTVFRIQFVRTNGRPAFFFESAQEHNAVIGPVFDVATGQEIGNFGAHMPGYEVVKISKDGNALYATESGLSGGPLAIHKSDLMMNSSGSLIGIRNSSSADVSSSGNMDLAVGADGTKVYALRRIDFHQFGGLEAYSVVDHGFQSITAPAFPSSIGLYGENIEMSPTGQLLYTTVYGALRYFDVDGSVLYENLSIASPSAVEAGIDMLRLSSDGLRVLGNGQILSLQ